MCVIYTDEIKYEMNRGFKLLYTCIFLGKIIFLVPQNLVFCRLNPIVSKLSHENEFVVKLDP